MIPSAAIPSASIPSFVAAARATSPGMLYVRDVDGQRVITRVAATPTGVVMMPRQETIGSPPISNLPLASGHSHRHVHDSIASTTLFIPRQTTEGIPTMSTEADRALERAAIELQNVAAILERTRASLDAWIAIIHADSRRDAAIETARAASYPLQEAPISSPLSRQPAPAASAPAQATPPRPPAQERIQAVMPAIPPAVPSNPSYPSPRIPANGATAEPNGQDKWAETNLIISAIARQAHTTYERVIDSLQSHHHFAAMRTDLSRLATAQSYPIGDRRRFLRTNPDVLDWLAQVPEGYEHNRYEMIATGAATFDEVAELA